MIFLYNHSTRNIMLVAFDLHPSCGNTGKTGPKISSLIGTWSQTQGKLLRIIDMFYQLSASSLCPYAKNTRMTWPYLALGLSCMIGASILGLWMTVGGTKRSFLSMPWRVGSPSVEGEAGWGLCVTFQPTVPGPQLHRKWWCHPP